MPAKRGRRAAGQDNEESPNKRSTTVVTRSVSRSQPPPATTPLPPPVTQPASTTPTCTSRWAQLPTELLALIFSLVSFRVALHLAFVNRRLYELIVKRSTASATATHHSSLWRNYPPVKFIVNESVRRHSEHKQAMWDRVVQVGADRFTFKRRGVEFVSSLLCLFREVASLSLDFPRYKYDWNGVGSWSRSALATAVLPSLQHFSQLQVLVVQGIVCTADRTLAVALSSLQSLVSLELDADEQYAAPALTAMLSRLCTSQLLHLTVSRLRLHQLVTLQPPPVMSKLRSLAVCSSRNARTCWAVEAVSDQWAGHFPSLRFLEVSCARFMAQLDIDLPFAYTADVPCDGIIKRINSRTLRLRRQWSYPYGDCRDKFALELRLALTHATNMRQLSVSDYIVKLRGSARVQTIFPTIADDSAALRQLKHIDLLEGLAVADLSYLLTPASPPVFAATLTHLALRVQWRDRVAAAALIAHLPATYPALTHAHVGVEGKLNGGWLSECEQWEDALAALRSALGAAWCEEVDDVLAWREDVAWRRAAGLPLENKLRS